MKLINKNLIFIFKVAVAILGIYIAYRNVEIHNITVNLSSLSSILLLTPLLITLLNIYISSVRLKILSKEEHSLVKLFQINLIGSFFNLFLPTSVGGDVIRTKLYAQDSESKYKSIFIILWDRIFGVTALYILALFGFVYATLRGINFGEIVNIAMIFFGIIIVSIWAISGSNRVLSLFTKICSKYIRNINVRNTLLKILGSISLDQQFTLSQIYKAIGLSIFFHLGNALSVFAVSEVLDLNISFIVYILGVSISNLLLLIPISIGGLGVRDIVFKILYLPFTSSSNIYLLAPIIMINVFFTGIVGAVTYIFYKKNPQVND